MGGTADACKAPRCHAPFGNGVRDRGAGADVKALRSEQLLDRRNQVLDGVGLAHAAIRAGVPRLLSVGDGREDQHGNRCAVTPARCGQHLAAPDSGQPSVRSSTREYDTDGAEQEFHVNRERPVVDVVSVHEHVFLEALDVAATAYLPQTREPARHLQPLEVVRLVALNLGREWRSGAYQAHDSAQDVDQLG